jgi:hypothetical protein
LLHFPLEAHEPKVNKAALDENSARNPGALVRGSASPSSLRSTGQSDQPGPSGKSNQTGQAKARAPQNNGPFEMAFLALMNQEIANGKGHETVGFNPILISLPNKPFTATRTFTDQRQETDCKGFRKKHWAMLKSRLKCTPVMAYSSAHRAWPSLRTSRSISTCGRVITLGEVWPPPQTPPFSRSRTAPRKAILEGAVLEEFPAPFDSHGFPMNEGRCVGSLVLDPSHEVL